MNKVSIIDTEPVYDINGFIKKKRVCAYCRVSSKKDEQFISFELQVSTYFKEITNNPNWEFAGIFADHGKSGTSIMKRDQFRLMVELAKLGEIDLILTKSISRFSRNTIDTLKVVQYLRLLNVEVFFEKENISTFDTNFDFYLTVLSSVAEEEARQISSNCLWNINKRNKEGISKNISKIYGFEITSEGIYLINKEEAKVVKAIFELFANGTTVPGIIKWLEANNIKSPNGLNKWSRTTVRAMLRQEKYVGDLLLQKYYNKGIGLRRKRINNNMKPKYYVTENHDSIISRELFNKVKNIIIYYNSKYGTDKETFKITEFTIKKKVNNKGKPYEEIILQDFDVKNTACKPISVTSLQQTILQAINELCANFGETFKKIEYLQNKKIIESNIENDIDNILTKLNELEDSIAKAKKMNIDNEVIDEILSNIYNEKSKLEMKYNEMRYKKVIKYDITNKLKLLKENIKRIIPPINALDNLEYKDIFSKVIANDRDDFIFCIHLTNSNLDDIDLESFIHSSSILDGKFNFSLRRTILEIKWKIIMI